MARTQAVYYRDKKGTEPVDEFIEALPAKRAAKIDDYVEEYLNGRPPEAPPPEFPISSQIEGELRELRVRFGNTRYRVLYQRSENLVVLLHAIEKDTGAVPRSAIELAKRRMTDFKRRWPPSAAFHPAPPVKMSLPRAEDVVDRLIEIDKLQPVSTKVKKQPSPKGTPAARAARGRGRRSDAYRQARDEYAEIRELRKKNWLAAHIRERRYELDFTQKQVAERAGTSHSFVSKLERGEHMPTIPVLKRILAVLDEELLIGVERHGGLDEDVEREVAPVPALSSR